MRLRPDLAPALPKQLEHLAALSSDDSVSTDELPMVRLLLRGGGTISGHIFRVDPAGFVLLGDSSGRQLSTLLSSEVIGLVVETSPSTASLFGAPLRRKEDPPTQLELKRRVKAIADKAGARLGNDMTIEIPWRDLPSSDGARGDLDELLERLDAALSELTGDELGVEALAPINTVRFQKASTVGVETADGTIVVSLRAQADRLLGPTELLQQLEASL